MRQLMPEQTPDLNERLQVLSPESIMAFPDESNESVLILGGLHRFAEHRWSRQLADAREPGAPDPVLQTVRFPHTATATQFSKNSLVADWRTLPTELSSKGSRTWRSRERLGNAQQQIFSEQFNALMDTATAQAWLLGIGPEPQETNGHDQYPPLVEVYRILPPTEDGILGYREAIGRGREASDALDDAVKRLGGLSLS